MSVFFRQVSSVFAGTLVAQLVPIIGSLAITRIFAPGEFGEFSTWLAFVSFLAVVITLRLETVLAVVEDGEARERAVVIVFFATLFMAICFAVALYVFSCLSAARRYLPEQTTLLVLVVPAALFVALNQVWHTWAAVNGQYGKLNAMRLIQAAAVVLIQIAIGLKYPTAASLAFGYFLACVLALASALLLMPKINRGSLPNREGIAMFFSRYKRFPIYALPADSINAAVAQLPVLVVFSRFGGEAAGYLALTMRVLGAPVGLVGKAVLDVFKRYAMQSIRKVGNCHGVYIRTFLVLAVSSLVMVVITLWMAEDIFIVAFGSEWVESGHMAVLLLPMFALGLIASPLSYVVYLVEKQHVDLLWQLSLMLVVFCALFGFSTARLTLLWYALGYAVMYVLYIFLSYKLSRG